MIILEYDLPFESTVQMTKLSTDPASAGARPGAAAPSRAAAPPPSVFGPHTMDNHPWGRIIQREMDGTFDPSLGKEAMAAAEPAVHPQGVAPEQPQPSWPRPEQQPCPSGAADSADSNQGVPGRKSGHGSHAAASAVAKGVNDSKDRSWNEQLALQKDGPGGCDNAHDFSRQDCDGSVGLLRDTSRQSADSGQQAQQTAASEPASAVQHQTAAELGKPRVGHPLESAAAGGENPADLDDDAHMASGPLEHLPNRQRSPPAAKPRTGPAQPGSHAAHAGHPGVTRASASLLPPPVAPELLDSSPSAEASAAPDMLAAAGQLERDDDNPSNVSHASADQLPGRPGVLNQGRYARQAPDGRVPMAYDAHAHDSAEHVHHHQQAAGQAHEDRVSPQQALVAATARQPAEPQLPSVLYTSAAQPAAMHADQQQTSALSMGQACLREAGAAPAVRSSAAQASGRNRQLWDGAAARLMRPMEALPPASQLDASVLDALPLAMKRELEHAYGEV